MPKVRSISKFFLESVGVKKKRHGHNFDLRASPLNQSGANRFEPDSMVKPSDQNCGRVLFF